LLPFETRIEATGIGPEAGMLGALMLGLTDHAAIEKAEKQEAVR